MSQHPNKSVTPNSKSSLKGLVGFLSGLVLATLIIIAVLLMINSNSKRDFKNTAEPVLTTPNTQQPDTLMPNTQNSGSQLTIAPPNTNTLSASQVIARANEVDETVPKTASVSQSAQNTPKPTIVEGNQAPKANADTRFNQPAFEEESGVVGAESVDEVIAPKSVVSKPRPTKQVEQVKPKPQTQPKPKRETPAVTHKIDPKPTPEQILESGNIEKARELARREARQGKKGNVVLQAGSFNSRDYAESQRAKLAMLGVRSHITEANVNGKIVYRVQTPKMSGEQANNAKSVMQRNGVGVYERSAN